MGGGGGMSREGNVVNQNILLSSLPSVAPISSVIFSHSLLFFSSPTLLRDRYALFELAGLDVWLRCIVDQYDSESILLPIILTPRNISRYLNHFFPPS